MPSEEVIRLTPEAGEAGSGGGVGIPQNSSVFQRHPGPSVYQLSMTPANQSVEPPVLDEPRKVKRDVPEFFPALQNEPMRNVRAREARRLGQGCLSVALIFSILMASLKRSEPWLIILCIVIVAYLVIVGLYGFFAKRLFIDGNDFLTEAKGDGFDRFSKREVTSVMMWALCPGFRCIRLARRKGLPVITLVRREDLGWVLFNLPRTSLPAEWRRKFENHRRSGKRSVQW